MYQDVEETVSLHLVFHLRSNPQSTKRNSQFAYLRVLEVCYLLFVTKLTPSAVWAVTVFEELFAPFGLVVQT